MPCPITSEATLRGRSLRQRRDGIEASTDVWSKAKVDKAAKVVREAVVEQHGAWLGIAAG
jgi:hypothetical protein